MKVSVIIPAYNKGQLTVRAVDRALNQTYKNLEVIVIDDGGKDCLDERLYPYLMLHKNLTYIWQSNRGASNARNRGIAESSGQYLTFLDCDDWYKYSYAISEMVGFMSVYGYFAIHTNNPPKGSLINKNYITNSSVMVRREVINEVGLFDEDLFISADWDMWLRIEEKYDIGYMKGDPIGKT